MTLINRLIAVILVSIAASFPAVAQTDKSSDRISSPTSFVEACADKAAERGRLRFCGEYFRDKLGTQADALLYLRDRITHLRASHEASAIERYNNFLNAIYIIAFLTIVSIVLVASERRIQGLGKWSSIASSAALLVIIVATTFGWLGKYRAELAAQLELGMLRDRIEAEAAQAISTGAEISPAMVREWTINMQAIGRRFAENYGGASRIPEIDRFHGE